MNSRSTFFTLLALCAACAQSEGDRPNVLLITLDTTRADRLGCYGWEDAETPNMDALAERGARFEFALSTAGITPMSHASILTGLNPYNHGLRVFSGKAGNKLAEEVPTLPERLAEAGYETAGFVSAYPLSPYYGLDQGFDSYRVGIEDTLDGIDLSKPVRSLRESVLLDQPRSRYQRRADATTDEALEWLESREGERPWFTWVHYFDAHDLSLVPPLAWGEGHGLDYDEIPSQRDLAAKEAYYDMEVAWMDAQLGRIFDKLRSSDELDNTLIVITADHGQGLSDGQALHGWSRHRLIYQWSIHVPLLMAGPQVPEGSVLNALVRTTDIAPTILELLDLPPSAPMDGASLLGLLAGEEPVERLAYADALNTLDSHAPLERLPRLCRDDLIAVTDGRHKLIHHRNTPAESELYDLNTDPNEQSNLYQALPETVAKLRGFLVEEGALNVRAVTPDGAGPDASALRDLGYTGEDEDSE